MGAGQSGARQRPPRGGARGGQRGVAAPPGGTPGLRSARGRALSCGRVAEGGRPRGAGGQRGADGCARPRGAPGASSAGAALRFASREK